MENNEKVMKFLQFLLVFYFSKNKVYPLSRFKTNILSHSFEKFGRCLKFLKNFQMQKFKNVEISLPFSGEGTKMATWILGGKCQHW